jgi:DNA-binding CsgD family transcriptional regulator/tetratricopeptide (TPR) repeat protein
LGREAELDAIDRALADDGAHPAAIVISGEPGIGKTTVWRGGTDLARGHGYQLLCCTPTRSEARLSFSGLADLLDQVPEPVVSALPAPQRDALEIALLKRTASHAGSSQRALRVAVTSVIRDMAQAGPVAVAVDEVRWLDTATASVLEFVFRRLAGLRVVALASTSSDRRETLPFGLDQALDAQHVLRVRLAPLSPPALGQLLQAGRGIALAKPDLLLVHAASGGNPRLAVQIAGELASQGARAGEPLPVPDGLARVVAQRMNTLPLADRTALLYAAALPDATIDQVRAAMDPGGAGALDLAEEAGIVEVRDGRIQFLRPFLAPVVYSTASPVRRRQIHGRLAEVVADDEQRAWHRALAAPGPDADVAGALAAAARAAQERSSPRVAARLWELAARRTPAVDPGGRRRRTVAAAACLLTAGDARRARAMAETVTAGMAPGRERAKLLLWLATITYCDNSPAEAVALCRQALGETDGDQALAAALHLRAAWFAEHDTSGRVLDAEAAVETMARVEAGSPGDMSACALAARGYYRFLAGQGVAWGDLKLARALLTHEGGSWEIECARFLLATWTASFDEPVAREDLMSMYKRVTELGYELAVPHVLTHLAELDLRMGDWPSAAAHAAEAIAAARQAGQQRAGNMALCVQACLHAHFGEIDAARDVASRGLALATRAGDQWVAASQLAALGFAAFSQRQLGTSDRCFTTADALLSAMGVAEPASHRFHADHIEVVVAKGDMARAAVLTQRLADRAKAAPLPWLRIAAARSRAILLAGGGDLAGAIEAVNEALAAHEGSNMPFEYGRTLLAAGQIRRRHKEKLLAAEALTAAKDIFAGLGAPLWAAQADAELSRIGLRRSPRRMLTPSEERVARMVAGGLTNREVASALFISHKTVEANLSRVFRKLGIRSRRELCAIESFSYQP